MAFAHTHIPLARRASRHLRARYTARPYRILLDPLERRLLLTGLPHSLASVLPPPSAAIPADYVPALPAPLVAVSHTNAIHAAIFTPNAVSPPASALTPIQIRSAYGINQILFGAVVGDGAGQTVAIVDAYHYPTAMFDLQQFDAQFNLPDLQPWNASGNTGPYLRIVNQSGGTSYPATDPNGPGSSKGTWEMEEALDLQWVHAIAPAANIILVEANDATNANLLTAAVGWARNQPGVSAVSMSFSQSESFSETTYDALFTTPAGHTGITFFAATGDSGQPAGYPAFSPNVVAVGGTHLNVSGNTYVSETGWSGSGGSVSTVENQPSYQTGVVTQSSTRRATPDVAMDADPNTGVAIYDSWDFSSSPWQQFGGTSLATPMWAGLMAIINQGRVGYGLTPLDGRTAALPKLYALPNTDFHDITSGNNGFAAGTGYDLVTGIGSPVANQLVMDMVIPPSASTGTPDLLPATDSGVSSTDNITNFNNSSPATELQFSVPITIVGATVNLYSDGTLIASVLASDTITTVTTTGSPTLTNGTHAITATQTQPGLGRSPASAALSINVDTSIPAVASQTPNGAVGGTPTDLKLTFNEAIDTSSFSLTAITSFKDPNNADLLPQITGFSWSGNTLDIQFNAQSAVGTYQLVLAPQLLDLAGNMMSAPYTATFNIVSAIYFANMNTNPGWTFDAGSAWAYGQPTGGGSHNLDPASGHTGNNVVGYNLSGDYPRFLSAVNATTPAIDCSAYQNLTLSFWRWLGVNSGATAAVQASPDNGSTWVTLWSNNNSIIADSTWSLQSFTLPTTFNGKSNVKFRWVMGPTGTSRTTYPGWNIDDVIVAGSPGINPTISGQVFLDANDNGAPDPGEAAIANASIFLDLNNNGTYDAGGNSNVPSTNVPLAIPDNNATGATSSLTLSGVSGLISAITITFNITHTFDSDLVGTLIAPDNTQITLFSKVGSSGDNFTNTTLSDSAGTSITAGAAPFAGTFRPNPGTLSTFLNKSANGTWLFKVTDVANQDTGTINAWSLNIATAPEPITASDSGGSYSFSVPAGNYTVREIIPANYVSLSPLALPVNLSNPINGQNFGLFPTIFNSSSDSYYLVLDAGGTTLLIAPDPFAPAAYQVPVSVLSSLTFNLTGGNQNFTLDLTNGPIAPAGGITLNASRGNNTTVTIVGQTNTTSYALTDTQFGLDGSPPVFTFNTVDNLILSNMTVTYTGTFSSILSLTLQNYSQLFWN